MPSLKTHATTGSAAALLLAFGWPAAGRAGPGDPDDAPRAIYQRACLSCHGAEGLGKPGLYPPLAATDWVNAPRPDRLIRIVLHGIAGPVKVNGQPFATPTPFMPGHAAALSDQEIATLLTWLRRSMRNHAGPVTPAEVTTIRNAAPQRSSMWTEAELLAFPGR